MCECLPHFATRGSHLGEGRGRSRVPAERAHWLLFVLLLRSLQSPPSPSVRVYLIAGEEDISWKLIQDSHDRRRKNTKCSLIS